jgi:ATP-dependent Clp protease ATP-binding subunit ClpA
MSDSKMLESLGLSQGTLRQELNRLEGAALKAALQEALALEHRYIESEHILLALTGLPAHDRAIRMINGIGWEPAQMRSSLLTIMRQAS